MAAKYDLVAWKDETDEKSPVAQTFRSADPITGSQTDRSSHFKTERFRRTKWTALLAFLVGFLAWMLLVVVSCASYPEEVKQLPAAAPTLQEPISEL